MSKTRVPGKVATGVPKQFDQEAIRWWEEYAPFKTAIQKGISIGTETSTSVSKVVDPYALMTHNSLNWFEELKEQIPVP